MSDANAIRLTWLDGMPHVLSDPVDAYSQNPEVTAPIAVAMSARPATVEEVEAWRAQG